MFTIRKYNQTDSAEVGRLIADTYREFNLSFASPGVRELMLGPFRYAYSSEKAHQVAITEVLESPILLVAEVETGIEEQIVGVLRGRKERLASLFVRKDYHRQGIGRRLVENFENKMRDQGVRVIRVAATLHAVTFYARLGYKKTTGVRTSWSFDGYGLPYQPMKKNLTGN
jgi:GNAT superfamily N-acetyltransferase